MKTRILFFCISCLLWASCENSRQNYVIEGTLPSVKYDGEWIYLVPMENAPGRVDSVKITNASFSFSGQGEEMRVLRLRHLLRIYSSLDAPHRVAQALVEGGVALQSIESRGANLEDYFLSMIGGVRHA